MQIPIDHYTLPNGLRVTLSEDHSAPIVAVNLWSHVGSANERPGRTGTSRGIGLGLINSAKEPTTNGR